MYHEHAHDAHVQNVVLDLDAIAASCVCGAIYKFSKLLLHMFSTLCESLVQNVYSNEGYYVKRT